MSGRFLALCALGLAGSLFVGYCVYFDSKRRSDPDYKKKVLAREFEHVTVQCAHWSCIIYIPCSVRVCLYERIGRRKAKGQSKMIDLRDPKVREEFLIGEMTAANQKMMEGGCGQPLVSCGTCRAPDPLTEKRVP
jgi:hypothetical protein